jgi:hypothetical protein
MVPEEVPAGSVAVFRTVKGQLAVVYLSWDGLWSRKSWDEWVAEYGEPLFLAEPFPLDNA